MKFVKSYLLLFCFLFTTILYAQRGKDGSLVVGTAGKIVNEYTRLTADAATGSTSLTVAASGLNANSRFAASLAPGDLVMVIQMQGATLSGTALNVGGGNTLGFPVDNTSGEITNYNNCGNYEFCQVAAVPNSTTITIDCGLQHDYTAAGRVQVVRVPRYTFLIINIPGTVTCTAWSNAYIGGVVAIEAKNYVTINPSASITASALGFRGGALSGNNSSYGGGQMSATSINEGAQKGEGVGGYQTDYNPIGGGQARGAGANAGGGGDSHNSAGGGGANAGNILTWDGLGNPDNTGGGWTTAWNLEAAGFATHTASGGGRGGYSFAATNQNATILGPWVSGTNAWAGDFRRNNGGLGGRPLDYSSGKLFLAGGGGAGDEDNAAGGTGGKGGGLIYINSYGYISGAGSITSNGGVGGNSGVDGAGGGGGGGTIVLNAVGTISGITVNANGGVGGNQVVGAFVSESEGPGGGGGGGYIAISNGAITRTANAGANGTTNSGSLTEFTPNGATKGDVGNPLQSITPNDTIITTPASICAGNTATLTASISGSLPATINWYDVPAGGVSLGTGTTFTTPALAATTTFYVGLCPGTFRVPVVVTVAASLPITVNSATICAGQTASLTATGATTYTWSAGTTPAGPNTVDVSPASTTTYTVTGTTGSCSGTGTATVTVTTPPAITVNSPTICAGQTATLTANNGTAYTWSAGATPLATNTATATPAVTTSYTVTGSVGTCSNTAIATVTVSALPTITVNSPTVCAGQIATLTANNGTSYTWSAGATPLGTNTATASPAITTSYTVTGNDGTCSNTAVATVTITPLPNITVNSPSICLGQMATMTANNATSYTWSTGATPTTTSSAEASPLITTSYTVTGTVGSCSNTAVSTINLLPSPTILVNSPTICVGQTASLSASGGLSYSWSAGALPTGTNTADASPTVTSSYTVTGSDGTCSNTAVATVTVAAALSITVNSPTICSGQTAILSASGGNTYTWSAGANPTGLNTADVAPSTSTTYTVTGASGTCSSTAIASVTVNTTPTVTVNSPSLCLGQTTVLTATGATTYTWSAGTTPAGPDSVSVSPILTSTYTVTGTTGTCSATAIATVTVDTIPNVLVNSPTICSGLVATLSASGATTYTWSAGANPTGVNTADASPTVTTTYTVTGHNSTCSNTALANVTVISVPSVSVNSDTICSGQTANLVATGASTFTWSAGVTPTSPTTGDASPLTTTSYTVTETNSGCSGSAIATVTVNITPTVLVNNATICNGQTAVLNASGASSYTWSSGATSSGANSASANPIINDTYTVTGTTNGCSATAVSTVTVNANPVVVISPQTICSGQPATLTATGATTYAWSAGATTTGVGTATASPSSTSTFTVIGTSNGCHDTAMSTVTVDTTPTVSVNSTTICIGQSATLTALGANSFTWTAGTSPLGPNSVTVTPIVTSSYTVTGTTNGCSNTAVATVTVNGCNPPHANFVGDHLLFCNNGCVNFTDLSTNGPTTWNWIFPGGTPGSSTAQNPSNICYSSVGPFTVILIVSNLQGADTLVMPAYVNIVAPIPVTITGNLSINACETTELTAQPSGSNYYWGPTISMHCNTCQTVTVNPSATQQYYVRYTDVNGCTASDTTVVNVTNIYSYYMPTGFSPNGDGNNDVLHVHGRGIDFINLKIFDRIGEKVFESTDINDGWDGTLHGLTMNDNVFEYVLEVNFCNGEIAREHGTLTLVR